MHRLWLPKASGPGDPASQPIPLRGGAATCRSRPSIPGFISMPVRPTSLFDIRVRMWHCLKPIICNITDFCSGAILSAAAVLPEFLCRPFCLPGDHALPGRGPFLTRGQPTQLGRSCKLSARAARRCRDARPHSRTVPGQRLMRRPEQQNTSLGRAGRPQTDP